jgi:hypothetical protein
MFPYYDSEGHLRADVPYFCGRETPGFVQDTAVDDVIFFRLGGGLFGSPFRVLSKNAETGAAECLSIIEGTVRTFSPHEAVRIQKPVAAVAKKEAA